MRVLRLSIALLAVFLLARSGRAAEPAKPEPGDVSTAPAEDMRLPARLDVHDPRVPPPPGYRVVVKRSDKRLVSGIVAASVSYAATAAIATHVSLVDGGTHARLAWPMYVPLVGSFATLGNVDPKAPSAELAYFGLAMTGAAQVVGFTMLAASIAFKQPELERVRRAQVQVRAAPLLAREMQGLGLAGSF